MSEFTRISNNTLAYLREMYGSDIKWDPYTNIITKGKVSMILGSWRDFWETVQKRHETQSRQGIRYFIDKETIIKSEASVVSQKEKSNTDKPTERLYVKKTLPYYEIINDFPFYIFDDLEEPRIIRKGKDKGKYKYNRGFEIVFDNKETMFSKEAEQWYNTCDKHRLNLILYAIHKNRDLINEHRWTLQTFSRVAYVAMCRYNGIEWKNADLYKNDNIYSLESMIFSVLICKCFITRCDFYNIVDDFGEEWDWPEDEKSLCECPANCRSLPVTHEWLNRWDDAYLLDLTPKEAKTYWRK